MNEQIFRLYDRVFDISFGWGIVKSIGEYGNFPIDVDFGDVFMNYTRDGKLSNRAPAPTLSFTEYTINNGFSQERPTDPKRLIGKWGKFWNDNKDVFTIGQLSWYYGNDKEKPYEYKDKSYTFFKPFDEEQVRILKL